MDTHRLVKDLAEADFAERQAEALVNVINGLGKSLVTRDFLRTEMEGLRTEMKLTEQHLTIRLGSLMIALSGLIIAAVKIL